MLLTSIFAPLLSVIILVFFMNAKNSRKMSLFRFVVTLVPSIISLAIARYILFNFDSSTANYQFTTSFLNTGILSGLNWSFGVDGISLGLYVLTVVIFPLVIVYSYIRSLSFLDKGEEFSKENLYYITLSILEVCILASFLAKNLIVFYIFWELLLFPMLLLIGIWGGENRKNASIKFFIYTFAGSAFLIIGIILLALLKKQTYISFDMDVIMKIIQNTDKGTLFSYFEESLFLAFIISFLIKIPVVPFHSWLPTAYKESPVVAVIISSILLKLGSYGIMRFSLSYFPTISLKYTDLFLALGMIGILYGALLAWVQKDIKQVIAYSSISHMGFIVVGLFAGTIEALSGAYIQMINHTISIALLFFVIGMLYDRTKSSDISFYSGVAKLSPALNVIFLIGLLSSIGLPGTNGFIGEFLILIGTFTYHPFVASVSVLAVILSAIYMLTLYKNVFMGEPSQSILKLGTQLKLKKREIILVLPLIANIFVFGLRPDIILQPVQVSLKNIIDNLNLKKESIEISEPVNNPTNNDIQLVE